jgi:site-specific recombinase XerD
MTTGRDGRLALYRRARTQVRPEASQNSARSRGSQAAGQPTRSGSDHSTQGREEPASTGVTHAEARRASRSSKPAPSEGERDWHSKTEVSSIGGVTQPSESAAMAADLAVRTWKEEEMRHPIQIWTDSAFADEPLRRLRDEWKRHLTAGTGKRAEKTVRKYLQDFDDFVRSLERHGLEPVLGSVTPDAVNLWVGDQEGRGNSPHSIAGRVISVKTFVSKYVFRTLELTNADLLRKVSRPSPTLQPRQVLTADELDALLAVYDRDSFEDVRDRAMMATFAATGLRFDAVRTLALETYDRVSGEFKVHEKGDVERSARLSPKAQRFMREYLVRRPRSASTGQLWVTDRGTPLSYWGGHMVVRRARERSGIVRLHAHLFRHGMAQHAADKGADIGTIQTLLGHKTAAMARRYAGQALDRQGARLMVQYSPIG